MNKEVFLSYSSKDLKAAAEICRLLEVRGVACWMAPRDVVPGRHYAEEIMDALEAASAVVLVLSDNSNDSRHVKNEIEVAVSQGKSIFPVRIRNVEPAKAIRLLIAGSQWVDAWVPPIEQKMDQLANAVRALTGSLSERQGEQANPAKPEAVSAQGPSASPVSQIRIAAIAAAVIIGLLAIWWQSTRTGSPGSVTIPSNPENADKGAPPTGESLAELDKLKSSLSDHIERRAFDDAASTISAMLALDGDNREALEAQALIDRLSGGGVTSQFDVPGVVISGCFSQDGHRLIAGSSGVIGKPPSGQPPGVMVWELDTGQRLSETPVSAGATPLFIAFSSDARFALSGGYFGLDLFNIETRQKVRHYDAGIAACGSFLPDGTRAVIGGSELALWDLELNAVLRRYQGHSDRVQSLAITPDGKRAVSAAADSTIRLWDLSKLTPVWSVDGPKVNFQSLAITPDARYILSGGDGVIRVLELDSGREVTRLRAHKGFTLSLAVSRDGKRALSGGTDNIVRLWDLSTARQLRAYSVKSEWTGAVAFSPEGRRALFGTINGGGLHVVDLPD